MKNQILILSACCLLFIVGSCTKFGKNITVKGAVLNPITEETISGIKVRLIKSEILKFYGGYKTIKETTTDANGQFELSAGRTGNVWIVTDYDYKDYYDLGWDHNGKYYSQLKVDKGEVMHVDYHLVPYGELKIHIQNLNCQGPTDSLDVFFDGSEVLTLTDNQDANNHIGSILYEPITGCWDKSNILKTQMGKRYYHWTVNRSGVAQTYYDTVLVEPNQTTTLNVFY